MLLLVSVTGENSCDSVFNFNLFIITNDFVALCRAWECVGTWFWMSDAHGSHAACSNVKWCNRTVAHFVDLHILFSYNFFDRIS